MFRTFVRTFLPNRFDWMLKRTARKGGKKILLGWNRGLGDIALGLYAMVQRIREFIPDAEIIFLTRENLREGFSTLEGVKTIIAPDWERGAPIEIPKILKAQFDLVIERPSPTDWVYWQRGRIVPRLKWDPIHDRLHEHFQMSSSFTWIGVQVAAETNYGLWRNWPLERWKELFDRLEKLEKVKVLLFGFGNEPKFANQNVVDLRGKTTLFELLSIIKHRCRAMVLPDSGILSMIYYLDEVFPIRIVSLWADPNHGILKQRVPSPNPQLVHCPVIAKERDLSTVSVDAVLAQVFPIENAAAILLAGGQGTRFGYEGPKGLFSIEGKTLFQWICETIPKHLPLAIMTSPLNHSETVAYFKKNNFFGLEVHFFQQEMLPFLDDAKEPMEIQGPNGNGNVFRSFVKAGLADLFSKKGIDLVTISYIDNPLAKPFDPALIFHARAEQADATVQCIERNQQDRSMGVLVEKGEKIEIMEYTELDSSREYRYGYSGQIAFTLPFFCKMAQIDLPIHSVRKNIEGRWVWKREQFIFDVLPYAARARAFQVPRKTHYAPLKERGNIEEVQKILREKK